MSPPQMTPSSGQPSFLHFFARSQELQHAPQTLSSCILLPFQGTHAQLDGQGMPLMHRSKGDVTVNTVPICQCER